MVSACPPKNHISKNHFWPLFTLFAFTNVIAFCEGGVLNASLDQLEYQFCITLQTLGFLLSLRDIGLGLSALYFGTVFDTPRGVRTIKIVVVLYPIFLGLFAIAAPLAGLINQSFGTALFGITRFVLGCLQGGYGSFFLLFIINFAPEQKCNICLSSIGMTGAIGYALGYIITIYLIDEVTDTLIHSYLIAGFMVLLCPVIPVVMLINEKYFDVHAAIERNGGTAQPKLGCRLTFKLLFNGFRALSTNILWMLQVIILILIHFSRNGTINWLPRYMAEYFLVENSTLVYFMIGVTVLTILGGLFGGFVVDRLGGNKTWESRVYVLVFFFVLLGIATVAGWFYLFNFFPLSVTSGLLTVLTTSTMLPGILGCLPHLVEDEFRSLSSVIGRTLQVLIGGTLASVFPGFLAKKDMSNSPHLCSTDVDAGESMNVMRRTMQMQDRLLQSLQFVGFGPCIIVIFIMLISFFTWRKREEKIPKSGLIEESTPKNDANFSFYMTSHYG